MEQLGLVLSRPSVIMERLRAMFSNADEVQGDSVPPLSANSCSACINLLIHLRKLGIWGTPLTVHNNTTKVLFFSPVWISFLLYSFDLWSLLFWGDCGKEWCSVLSLELSYLLLLFHYYFSSWLFFSFLYHLSPVLYETQNSTHKDSITETDVVSIHDSWQCTEQGENM